MVNEMTGRQDSNLFQQIRNAKNRTIVRPTTFAHICYLTWQGHVESNHDLRFWRPLY